MNRYEIFNDPKEKPLDRLVPDGGYTAIFRTICCIGDSLSSGEFEAAHPDGSRSYHDMFEHSWGQYMARMCGSKVYNFSRGGMTAMEYCESFAENNGFWSPAYASDAYIIALGVNDLICLNQDTGTADDIDFCSWRNNRKSFAGYYGQIIQRLRLLQPRAKFFLMTFPKDEYNFDKIPGLEQRSLAHRKLLYELAQRFDNTYVLDLYSYAPPYDEEFHKRFYLLGHLSPAGYLLTAKMTASYIDYIIRHDMDAFKEVGFIGTGLHG